MTTDEAIVLDDCRVVPGRIIRVLDKKKTDYDGDGFEDNTKNVKYVIWVEDANGKNERALMFTKEQLEFAEKLACDNPEDIPKKGFIQDLID